MKIEYKNTVLLVRDIHISKRFYIDILNQQIEIDLGLNIIFRSGISLWELRNYLPITKMLGTERLQYSKANKLELYFETEDLSETENLLKESRVSFLHHIHEEPWGQKTIRFFDPDDHLIEIGEKMEVFVKRFHDSGMNAEQISNRTSIPEKLIADLLKK